MIAARALLALAALGFAAFGLWGVVNPVGMLATVGVRPTSSLGEVELRAMYGGLELGIAAFLAYCVLDTNNVSVGLFAAACLYGGLGGVRALAALRAPGVEGMAWVLVAVEAVAVGLCLLGLRLARG